MPPLQGLRLLSGVLPRVLQTVVFTGVAKKLRSTAESLGFRVWVYLRAGIRIHGCVFGLGARLLREMCHGMPG